MPPAEATTYLPKPNQIYLQFNKCTFMQNNSIPAKVALLTFSILTFYCFGVGIALQFISYPTFDKVHEHWQDFMNLFNQKMIILLLIPYTLLAIASLLFYKFAKSDFDKKTILASVGLSIFSVSCTFIFINPIHNKLPLLTNFNEQAHQNLVNYTFYLQILPLAILSITILKMLNSYFKSQNPIRRWLFLSIFALMFYTSGTNTIEVFAQYPLWKIVGQTDWLPYRQTGTFLTFALVYLIPGFLNLLLIIPAIWLRPKGVPIIIPIAFFLLLVITSYFTATYFVPDIQEQLDKAYSINLIDELIKNDFKLRGLPELVCFILLALTFLKTGRTSTQTT